MDMSVSQGETETAQSLINRWLKKKEKLDTGDS